MVSHNDAAKMKAINAKNGRSRNWKRQKMKAERASPNDYIYKPNLATLINLITQNMAEFIQETNSKSVLTKKKHNKIAYQNII